MRSLDEIVDTDERVVRCSQSIALAQLLLERSEAARTSAQETIERTALLLDWLGSTARRHP